MKGVHSRAARMALSAFCMVLATLAAVAEAVDGEAKKKPRWGPDNPKPFILKYQKYVGPFMAMYARHTTPPAAAALTPAAHASTMMLHLSAACSVTPPWMCCGTRAGTDRLTFVILGGMILFICMYERKERKQWPFGPWNMAAARAADKKKE